MGSSLLALGSLLWGSCHVKEETQGSLWRGNMARNWGLLPIASITCLDMSEPSWKWDFQSWSSLQMTATLVATLTAASQRPEAVKPLLDSWPQKQYLKNEPLRICLVYTTHHRWRRDQNLYLSESGAQSFALERDIRRHFLKAQMHCLHLSQSCIPSTEYMIKNEVPSHAGQNGCYQKVYKQ